MGGGGGGGVVRSLNAPTPSPPSPRATRGCRSADDEHQLHIEPSAVCAPHDVRQGRE